MKLLIFTLGQIARGEFEKDIYMTKAHIEAISIYIDKQIKEKCPDIIPLFVGPEVTRIELIDLNKENEE